MKIFSTVAVAALLSTALFTKSSAAAEPFSPYVDEQGNISLPEHFRGWQFLGTWGVATDEDDAVGSKGFHNVYTQPETAATFRSTGQFPDGAVLVKELLKATTDTMTTGEISYAAETEGWFIMIKDTEGRFEGNPLWGDAWGWALFNADEPTKTVTEDYEDDCLPCHQPAKQDDWIYVRGYPELTD